METKIEKILVPIDGSANSERAIMKAKKYAECFGGKIILLTVVKPLSLTYYGNIELSKLDNENLENAKKEVLQEALTMFDDFEGEVQANLRKGNPAEEILEEIEEEDYDLVVMGSRGLGAFSRTVLGSVSNKVLNHAKTNVLIVR